MFGAKTFSIEEYVLFDKKHTHGMCHHPVIINIKKACVYFTHRNTHLYAEMSHG